MKSVRRCFLMSEWKRGINMCKRVRVLFCLTLAIMLTACKAKGNDSADNALTTDVQTTEQTEVPAELPTANPTDEPTEVPVELPTPKPTISQTATPILTPEVEVEQTPRPKGDIPERSYESHADFPYENMDFVDDATYAFLKKTYDEIDFYGEFQTGDLSVYDEYIEAYRKLLNNEIPFIVQDSYYRPGIGESLYMREYSKIQRGDEYDPDELTYYLFDMDGDGNPELCIHDRGASYIFKYDMQSKEMILWLAVDGLWESIHGTLSLRNDYGGLDHWLCRLNAGREVVFGVRFMEEAFWSNGEIAYMVTLPFYENKEIEITMDMKKQAYFDEEVGRYYFNVTEEQYDELTKNYFLASDLSEEELEKVTYTYEELFSDTTVQNTELLIETNTSLAHSSEGAQITGVYSEEHELQSLYVDIYGETGRAILEYTFMVDKIIYVHHEIIYEQPFYMDEDLKIQEVNSKKYIISEKAMYDITDAENVVKMTEKDRLKEQEAIQEFLEELDSEEN